MKTIKLKLALILFIFITGSAYAGNVLDTILLSYSEAAKTWSDTLLPVARYIFWFVASLEFIYQFTVKKLLPNELQKLWVFLIVRVFVASFLAIFALDLNVYTGIISWMARLGALCGGISFTGGGGVLNYSPSAVFELVWKAYSPTLTGIIAVAGTASLIDTAIGLFLLGLAGMIIICILVMVFSVMLVLVEAYFVIFGGIILAGFAGSSWTLNYWQKYLSYVSGVAVRLFCTSLLMGLIAAQLHNPTWIKAPPPFEILHANEYLGIFVTNIVSMLAVFGFNMILMLTIPSKAGAMLNGSVNASLSEAIGAASTMLSGGKMMTSAVAGVATGAAKLGLGVTGANAAAKSAGFKVMRDGMRNNTARDTSSDDKWKQIVRATGQSAAKDAAVDSIKGGIVDAKKAVAGGMAEAKNHAGAFAKSAGSIDSGSGGGAALDINPHKE
ncbi:MAG: conjugal transfer protein TrbL [Burkholderiales bacterium]|jgi:type IV secretion system protein TrbL|nr:conjugal transfer protein TrbL [Burkholderiales bacterium]